MKRAEILIGLPYSGKSTYARASTGFQVVSTDSFIEEYADSVHKTYDQVFNEETYNKALINMNTQLYSYLGSGVDIIWDQTNLTKLSRAKKINTLKDHFGYTVVAVVFPILDSKTLQERMYDRAAKIVPHRVLDDMRKRYQVPSLDEGFDEIIFI